MSFVSWFTVEGGRALLVPCPTCEVPAHEPCVTLATRHSPNRGLVTRGPHKKRIPVAA